MSAEMRYRLLAIEARTERYELALAIASAASKLGMSSEGVALTGPHLLMLLGDMVEFATNERTRADVAVADCNESERRLIAATALLEASKSKFKYIAEDGIFYLSTAAEGMRAIRYAQSAPAAEVLTVQLTGPQEWLNEHAATAKAAAAEQSCDTVNGCGYEHGDWECREGGYLWYAGDGEGYDPNDCSYICPHCRTKDYLEAAKDEAESVSSFSNNGSSGTGVDIWTVAERRALLSNEPAARQALSELGPVSALDGDGSAQGYSVVLCNTQEAQK